MSIAAKVRAGMQSVSGQRMFEIAWRHTMRIKMEEDSELTDDRNKRRAKSTPARARYAEAYHVILPSAEGDNRRRSVGAAGEETYRGEEETPRGEASPDGAVDGGAPPLSTHERAGCL